MSLEVVGYTWENEAREPEKPMENSRHRLRAHRRGAARLHGTPDFDMGRYLSSPGLVLIL